MWRSATSVASCVEPEAAGEAVIEVDEVEVLARRGRVGGAGWPAASSAASCVALIGALSCGGACGSGWVV